MIVSYVILKVILSLLIVGSGTIDVDFVTDLRDEYDDTDVGEVSSNTAENNYARRTLGCDDTNEDFARVPAAVTETVPMLASYPTVTDALRDYTASVTARSHNGLGFGEADDNSGNYYDDPEIFMRDKRSLTFPDPSTILLIFGLGTPLQLDRESIIVGAFTKMLYNLPLNSTDFTEPGVYFARTKTRWSIYKVLESAAELYGFGAGKGCLLRAICEVSAAPFDLHHGLFGQMVQAFLTPSSTSEEYDEYGDREYHAAERLGRNVDESCHALYPECRRSILDVFSTTGTTRNEAREGSD